MNKKTAIYGRTNNPDKSIDDQIRVCKRYAKEMGLRIKSTLIFTDVAVSGLNQDRIGLKKLLDEVRSGKVHVVITEDLSRVSRDTVQVFRIIHEFAHYGVSLHSVSDQNAIKTHIKRK